MPRLSFEDACKGYKNRFTMEHVPYWATSPWQYSAKGPTYHAPHFVTDREWYENSYFPGEENYPFQENSGGNECFSRNQSYPLGRHLNKRFEKIDGADLTDVSRMVAVRDEAKKMVAAIEELAQVYWEKQRGHRQAAVSRAGDAGVQRSASQDGVVQS